MEAESDPRSIVGSIIKASTLLELYATDRREISLGEFTREVGYNKTTTYRLLQTMVSAGWLVRSASGGYRLGLRLLFLGAIARQDLDLRNEALPYLQKLADEVGDTAFLMVPGDAGAVTIEAIVGPNPVRVHGVMVGSVLPYYAAAGPVVLAANIPELEEKVLNEPRARFTSLTTVSEATLRAKFAEVRELGYALSMEDYIEDVAAVGAPILDIDGRAIASLSVGGPANRYTGEMRKRAIELVMESARALTAHLKSGSRKP